MPGSQVLLSARARRVKLRAKSKAEPQVALSREGIPESKVKLGFGGEPRDPESEPVTGCSTTAITATWGASRSPSATAATVVVAASRSAAGRREAVSMSRTTEVRAQCSGCILDDHSDAR